MCAGGKGVWVETGSVGESDEGVIGVHQFPDMNVVTVCCNHTNNEK